MKCPNCEYNNNKYKTNYDTNHSAIDSQHCEILKNKIKKYIESTDYPIQPSYQRYFGKVGSNFSRKTPTRQTVRNTSNLPTTRITWKKTIGNQDILFDGKDSGNTRPNSSKNN